MFELYFGEADGSLNFLSALFEAASDWIRLILPSQA